MCFLLGGVGAGGFVMSRPTSVVLYSQACKSTLLPSPGIELGLLHTAAAQVQSPDWAEAVYIV